MKTVGQLAKRFGLSRSTLLYYDEIGLLAPSARSRANYRLYSAEDVRRMERIHLFREAGIPLEVIGRLLDEDSDDAVSAALERQLAELTRTIARLRRQQHLIAKLIGDARVLRGTRSLTKEQWVALLASSGMSDEAMWTWHAEFERHFPEAHQDFLESLGIPQEEIELIRAHSARGRSRTRA